MLEDMFDIFSFQCCSHFGGSLFQTSMQPFDEHMDAILDASLKGKVIHLGRSAGIALAAGDLKSDQEQEFQEAL